MLARMVCNVYRFMWVVCGVVIQSQTRQQFLGKTDPYMCTILYICCTLVVCARNVSKNRPVREHMCDCRAGLHRPHTESGRELQYRIPIHAVWLCWEFEDRMRIFDLNWDTNIQIVCWKVIIGMFLQISWSTKTIRNKPCELWNSYIIDHVWGVGLQHEPDYAISNWDNSSRRFLFQQ